MRILVLSDSHGNVENMARCAELTDPNIILHLGDCQRDAEALHRQLPAIPMQTVPGNCDWGAVDTPEVLTEYAGVRILMMHGHTHGVSPYSYDKAAYRAEELHCSVLLFGHTHISIVNNDGRVLAVNPGSPSCPRGGRSPSFALLEIENGDVRAEIITM